MMGAFLEVEEAPAHNVYTGMEPGVLEVRKLPLSTRRLGERLPSEGVES